jgi:hypothetical protein
MINTNSLTSYFQLIDANIFKIMTFNKKSEIHRPTVPQPRNSRWVNFAEIFFGGVAKATLAVAAVIAIILAIASGSAPTDLPTTRKEFGIFLLILLAFVICAVLAAHFHWRVI